MAGLAVGAQRPGQGRGAYEHAVVPAAALQGSPACGRDWDFACDVSRPSPYLLRPRGIRECPSVQEFCRITRPDRLGRPLFLVA
jgi:hypothetical protein